MVAQVTAELGVEFEELSILDDPDLQARYWEQIPVTLVDGEQHDFWRVSETQAAGCARRPEPGGQIAHFVLTFTSA